MPTLVAAVVCGSSVLAIAVSGSFALDGGDPDVQTFAKVITSVTGSGRSVPDPLAVPPKVVPPEVAPPKVVPPEMAPPEMAPLPPAATAPDRTLQPLP